MKILHENEFGNIAKCKCCQELQLSLGSVIITFSEKEYMNFDNFFDEIRKDFAIEKPSESKQKKYVVVTNHKGLVLSFTYQELYNTIELLNFSTLMLSVNQLTSLSEK
ncbi:MAG: hypothetical protein H6587_11010 [Flavobacteriales bacterium]|nr:hypothetical protein [Flavobacteriales bacterium]MCB9365088.1 hypothetical protein [Flavobacteriales bacterium]